MQSRAGAHALSSSIAALGLSDTSLLLLRDLIADRAGVYFDDNRLDLLADKLSEHLVALGIPSLLDYYYVLRYDAESERHWAWLMDRLSVPETYFWRQADQFETLARFVAPAHFERHPSRPLRIWSAACCTGEEPISIAMALAEAGLLAPGRVQIVGSDASGAMLERARAGVYRERALRQLPASLRDKYLRPEGSDAWRPAECLSNVISWHRANLMNPAEWAPFANADVVFCRNVFIYFADSGIRKVAGNIVERMPEDGHLFLGASESLTRLGLPLDLVELGKSFVYVKRKSVT